MAQNTDSFNRRTALKKGGVAISTLAVGLPTISGTTAAARDNPGPPVSGSGDALITNLEAFPVREVGGNTFEDRVLHGKTVSGPLDGTFEQTVSGKVHASGRVVFRGRIEFTGSLGDCGEGTLNLGVSGRGHVPQPGFPITEASVRVIDQATNTIDVTGTGSLFQRGPELTYDIQYVC